jgi:CheY-like chemotaxis protein
MDLQMPEMDGYQATARLRSDPRFVSFPIIAMTAHATIEERQRCLASGMSDHISKPIDPANLFETVGRYCKLSDAAASPNKGAGEGPPRPPEQANAGSSSPPPQGASEPKPPEGRASQAVDLPSIDGLDTGDGLGRVAGNRKLYLKLLRQFIGQQGPAAAQVAGALKAGDAPLAERLAHTLKGVAGNIGAKSVQAAAGTLEKLIRSGAAAAEVAVALQQVAEAMDPLVAQLQAALGSPDSSAAGPVSTPAPVNPARSREAAEQLNRLLSEFDPGAAEFIEANADPLRPLFGGDGWARFEQLVQNYSFAEAQGQLEQALNHFPRE